QAPVLHVHESVVHAARRERARRSPAEGDRRPRAGRGFEGWAVQLRGRRVPRRLRVRADGPARPSLPLRPHPREGRFFDRGAAESTSPTSLPTRWGGTGSTPPPDHPTRWGGTGSQTSQASGTTQEEG